VKLLACFSGDNQYRNIVVEKIFVIFFSVIFFSVPKQMPRVTKRIGLAEIISDWAIV